MSTTPWFTEDNRNGNVKIGGNFIWFRKSILIILSAYGFQGQEVSLLEPSYNSVLRPTGLGHASNKLQIKDKKIKSSVAVANFLQRLCDMLKPWHSVRANFRVPTAALLQAMLSNSSFYCIR